MNKISTSRHHSRVLDSLPLLIVCCVIVAVLYGICISGIATNNVMRYMIQIFLYIILGEMWNLLSGYAGMTSLGQQLYIGLSGYAVAVVTSTFKLPLGTGIIIAVIVCTVIALLMSIILFRMEGMYFSIATWVVAEMFSTFFFSWKFVGQGSGMTIRVSPYPRMLDICILSLTFCVAALVVVY